MTVRKQLAQEVRDVVRAMTSCPGSENQEWLRGACWMAVKTGVITEEEYRETMKFVGQLRNPVNWWEKE